MSNFIINDGFNNISGLSQGTQMNQFNSYTSTGETAILWLIPSRKYDPTWNRPYVYNSNGNNTEFNDFIVDVHKYVNEVGNDFYSTRGMLVKDSAFSLANNHPGTIMPESNGIAIDTSKLSYTWSFVLVLDNCPRLMASQRIGTSNRHVYSGVIINDEPVVNQNGQLHFNEQAVFLVTHVDCITIRKQANPGMGMTTLGTTYYNKDVLHPDLCNRVSEMGRNYLLDPASVLKTGMPVYSSDGTQIMDDNSATLASRDRSVAENTMNSVGKYQLSNLLRSMATVYASDKNATEFGSDSVGTNILMDSWRESDVYAKQHSLVQQLEDTTNGFARDNYLGLDIENPHLTMGELLRKYPILHDKTIVLQVPFSTEKDLLDESGPNMSNIFTALIKNAVPAILADAQIADVTFRYASRDMNRPSLSTCESTPIWKIDELSTFVPEQPQVTAERFNRALVRMQQMVFDDIVKTCGDFDVLISFHTTGGTLVQLQLLDFETNKGFSYTESVLRGVVSPVLGMKEHFSNHKLTLNNLTSAITNLATPNSPVEMWDNRGGMNRMAFSETYTDNVYGDYINRDILETSVDASRNSQYIKPNINPSTTETTKVTNQGNLSDRGAAYL